VALRPAAALAAGGSEARRAALKASAVLPVASSPYATRRDSAFLDAALIELLVDASPRFQLASLALAALPPGTQLACSEPLGAGFASLLSPALDLGVALEEARALLLLGAGAEGCGALRSVLSWQPVAARAGVAQTPVTCFLQASGPSSAPYVSEWDRWREAGVRLTLCSAPTAPATSPLEEGLLRNGRRMSEVCGAETGAVAVLFGPGLSPEVRGRLTRELAAAGFPPEWMLFADPY